MRKVNLIYVNYIAIAFLVMTIGMNVYGALNGKNDVGNTLFAQGTGGSGGESCPTCVDNKMLKYVTCIRLELTFENGAGGSSVVCKLVTGDKLKCKSEAGASCDTTLQEPCTDNCGQGGSNP